LALTDNERTSDEGESTSRNFAPGFSPGAMGIGTPLYDPTESTPLEENESEGTVPPALLWAMKDRRHFHLLPEHRGAKSIRACLGSGNDAVYAIDDGHTHCMIGRRVGSSPDGCIYCLVARIPLEEYLRFGSGELVLDEIFSAAHDLSLCGVFEDEQEVSNVLPVQHFAHIGNVPREYLPPSPFIKFSEGLSTDP
jgi:hypothetical protein